MSTEDVNFLSNVELEKSKSKSTNQLPELPPLPGHAGLKITGKGVTEVGNTLNPNAIVSKTIKKL